MGGRRGPAVESMKEWDVIVVGGGNAAFCAALAAREAGASVLMLEAAPEEESGGNSRFTAGAMRVVYNGVDDIKALIPDLSQAEIDTTDFGTYTQDQFFDDMARVTQFRTDPDLCESWWGSSAPGCARRASASCRSTAARRSRSRDASNSGAG
jgi:succinate dehydrogenase/fumarate reductase flavoprotein subunit